MPPIPTAWLRDAARAHPDRLALRDGAGRSLRYAELLAAAEEVARSIAGEAGERAEPGADAGPGGLIALELPPGLEHAVCLHAAMLLGRPVQTIRPGLPEADRARALGPIAPSLIIDSAWARTHHLPRMAGVSAGSCSGAAAAPSPPPPDRTLSRVLTSGTSGEPAPVDLSFANHYASARASAANLGVEEDDLWLCCLPLDHVGGLTIPIRSVIYGTAALIHERFDLDAVAEALAADVTVVSLVPTQLHRLLEAGADLSRQRVVLVGGAALPAATLDRALARGVNVVQTYGLTEACSQVCTLPPDEAARKRGSSGRPLPGVEVRIESGEVLVRGPNVAAASLRDDGWLRTGDLGRPDEDGHLWVEGRADETIVSGGETIRPEEVEDVLLGHPAVAEAAAFGRPDPEWGQAVTAAVVLAPGSRSSEEGLRAFCRERLAPYKVPKAVELRPELPRTGSGKLQRRLLR